MKVLFLVFAFQRCNSFYISIIRHCENVSCNPKLRPYIRAKKKRRKKERKKKIGRLLLANYSDKIASK